MSAHVPKMDVGLPLHPGEILVSEFLEPRGWTLRKLAKKLGVPLEEVEGFAAGKRDLTDDLILGLAELFKTSVQFWKNLQSHYDGSRVPNLGSIYFEAEADREDVEAEVKRTQKIADESLTFGVRLCNWLRTSNAQLKGKTPLEVLAAGDFQVVADFVDDLITGSLT